jgi:hypothetical protein
MRSRFTRIAAGGALGLTVLAGGAVVVPAVASAAVSPETDATTEITKRVTRITEALAGLVTNGTITQQQADEVAQRLAEDGFGSSGHGHGHGRGGREIDLSAAAQALNLSDDELRDALSDGDTLAEVAEEQGVDVQTVVDALVAAAQERLASAVQAGRLTQEEADEKAADLQERVTALVQEGGPLGRGHHRHGRFGGGDGPAAADETGQTQTPAPEVLGSATSTRVTRGEVVAV